MDAARIQARAVVKVAAISLAVTGWRAYGCAATRRSRAVRIHPAVAIIAILVGGELAGILGALPSIPAAATIGVLIDEALLYRRETGGAEPGEVSVTQPEPAAD